ncbi:hypothetical protein vseg_006319 [Gypsophila vaccaria]
MTSKNVQEHSNKFLCKCHYCCLTPLLNLPNSHSLDHQNSTNIANSSSFQYDFATATISSLYPHTHFTNPESLPTLHHSFRSFTTAFPQFLTSVESDQIRADEFHHLSTAPCVCLDYTGHALFSFSQRGLADDVSAEFEASSSRTPRPRPRQCRLEVSHKARDESIFEKLLKRRIMKYLNVSEDEYSVFFTTNQTSAFKIVGDSYPFKPNNKLITVYDHENEAVEALIEASKHRKARVSTAEFKWPKLKIHCKKLEELLLDNGHNNVRIKTKTRTNRGLFVFPVQSKVSGAKYSYQWMSVARENGWHVLLDCTSLGPKDMDTLGLSLFRPDFLICTFYRVFGYDPSGFACLLVKRSDPLVLDQSCFSSSRGFVTLIDFSCQGVGPGNQTSEHQNDNSTHLETLVGDQTSEDQNGNSCLEECYVECRALDHADSLGLALIGTRTRCLVNWLANALLALSHSSSDKDVQLVQVYGPRVRFDRGPALAFNVFDWKGEKLDPILVQKLGDRSNISLGYGCLKHIWFSDRYEVEKNNVMDKRSKEGKKSLKTKKNEISVVTINVGYLTNFEDVYRVWEFIAKFLDADFVEKERWRYIALNQKTILV